MGRAWRGVCRFPAAEIVSTAAEHRCVVARPDPGVLSAAYMAYVTFPSHLRMVHHGEGEAASPASCSARPRRVRVEPHRKPEDWGSSASPHAWFERGRNCPESTHVVRRPRPGGDVLGAPSAQPSGLHRLRASCASGPGVLRDRPQGRPRIAPSRHTCPTRHQRHDCPGHRWARVTDQSLREPAHSRAELRRSSGRGGHAMGKPSRVVLVNTEAVPGRLIDGEEPLLRVSRYRTRPGTGRRRNQRPRDSQRWA